MSDRKLGDYANGPEVRKLEIREKQGTKSLNELQVPPELLT